ncbi:MAG TPA: hypothetical protein VK848_11510 [Acidimicrobiia bacterium]|nr:hypothetical protein [Acidimicrobiia bacterium]
MNDTHEGTGGRMNLIGALWVIPLAMIVLAVAARMSQDREPGKPNTTEHR